jgi:hypothetical protein
MIDVPEVRGVSGAASGVGDASFGSAACLEAFEKAAAAAGDVIERSLVIAGRPVVLRFAGARLLPLAEAFEHLEVLPHAKPPVLRVHLWDQVSTGVAAPTVPYEGRIGEPAGLRVLWQRPPLRVVLQPGQSTFSAIDEETGDAWFCCDDPDSLPFWEYSAPIRMILHWWLGAQGAMLLHAAAVGFPGGGALIVGRGGSGKSTTSLLALRHGLSFASDDYVAVEPGASADTWPTVHSLFATGKLTADQYDNFPELQAGVINADKLETEKAVVFVRRVAASQVVRGFPLRAVLVPRITGRPETTFRPASPMAALASLAPSTIFQLPGAASANLAAMAGIVRRVPTYALDLGRDLDGVPVAIEELLRSLQVSET